MPSPIAKQVRIEPGGLWHRIRQGNGGDHTACGKLIPTVIQWTRDYKLDALICYECFTPDEIATGEIAELLKEDERFPPDLPVSKRPSSEERRALKRRELAEKDTLRDLPPSGMPAPGEEEPDE